MAGKVEIALFAASHAAGLSECNGACRPGDEDVLSQRRPASPAAIPRWSRVMFTNTKETLALTRGCCRPRAAPWLSPTQVGP